MPDALPVPREAVESFIRDKGVTKVPRGATGLLDEDGNLKPGVFKWGGARRKGRPRKAPPPAPRPGPAPEPHLPARRANVERFAAAMEAKPEPPKAPEKPSAAHTGAEQAPAPEAPSKADPATGRSRLKHDDEIRQMAENGWSIPMIAEALGMARSGVRKACDRLGLEPRKERARDSDRKRQVGELIEAGKTAVEIAEAVSLTPARVYQIATLMGVRVPSRTEAAKDRIRELVAAGKHVGEIAEALDRSEQSVYVTLGRLGLKAAPKPRARKAAAQPKPKKANPKRPGRNSAADVKKAERAQRHAGIVSDRRRFRTVAVPMGEPAVELAPDHEAVKEGRPPMPRDTSQQNIEELRAEIERLHDIIRGLTGQDDQPIDGLSANQMRIVRALEKANGRALSRFALLDAIWWDKTEDESEFRIIDHYIKKIRKQRPDIGARIRTHYGVGYSMEPAHAP